jgi:hypothetical protein
MTALKIERVKAILDPKIYGTLSNKDLAAITSCDIDELVTIFDSCIIADQGFLGIVNQPRCTEKCGGAIDTLMTNRIDLAKHHVIEELRLRVPKTQNELDSRNMCLAQWAILCGNWPEAIKALVDLVGGVNGLVPATAAPLQKQPTT